MTRDHAAAPASDASSDETTRLARRLSTFDAVVVGLGAMLGAGIFTALAPAAGAVGDGLAIALIIAAFVAYCNATSSAALAAIYPESGGAYVYGRVRLGGFAGFLAGWGFVTGKLASCAAMALTFGLHATPSYARPLAATAVIALTAINYRGVTKTAGATKVIVAIVLLCLALVVAASLGSGSAEWSRALPSSVPGGYETLQAAGFLFFAFAGYARIATLGEEVVAPTRTIPRAIPLALAIALIVYALVALSALASVGAAEIARTPAPLVAVVERSGWPVLAPMVRVGAAIASLGVLLSLVAGVSRTVFAMAANGDLPRWLASVHPRFRVPNRAELVAATIIVGIVLFADVGDAIGFSAFTVLVYYAIANAAALTLERHERRWPRALAVAGIAGCAMLAACLPMSTVVRGTGVMAVGALTYAMLYAARRPAAKRLGRS
jgi:APA family basic amino acid/polyamine antiporter